ncbi:MAG: hypothetical protein EA350_12335 [Gemmatimonadales bacterium]|nr:MAG: hypothetical protein EA350_12335 [Gemmatimonadales bacterium]
MLALLTGGCFSYVPVETSEVRTSDVIRARISAAQAEELEPILQRQTREVEGRVLGVSPDFMMRVPVQSQLQGASVQTLHQQVRIPPSEISFVELRQLDRTRTGFLAAGSTALLVLVLRRAYGGESGGDSREVPPTPGEIRIPVSLPFSAMTGSGGR